MEKTNIILTRYLYSKIDVKQSLLLALLEHNHEEALFWGYELYYSGFENDVFVYLSNIFEFIYSFDNEYLREKFRHLLSEWKYDNSLDWHLGSIIITLSCRNYNLKYFMKAYFDYHCEDFVCSKKPNTIIHLKEKDIERYKTVTVSNPNEFLKKGCKYPIRKEVNKIFHFVELSRSDFELYWLYYCKDTPFWIDNIIEHDGMIDDFNKRIVFLSDTKCEAFYDKWNIEPDDQPEYIYDYCIGKSDVVQLSLDDFYNKYKEYQSPNTAQFEKQKHQPVAKKIKFKIKPKTETKPMIRTDLTNSIVYK